jgi:hypothetical protein
VESTKSNFYKERVEWYLSGVWEWEYRELLVKYKLAVMRWLSSRELMTAWRLVKKNLEHNLSILSIRRESSICVR